MTELRNDYDVILCDPPWRYDFSMSGRKKIENHYPTMALDELIAMRSFIDTLHNGNAGMFMWATAPKLEDALRLLREWGFTYKTNDAWIKVARDRHRDQLVFAPEMESEEKKLMPMGFYTRVRHEHILIGTRGDFSPPPRHLRPQSAFYAERGQHSVKPAISYKRIEAMYPDARRIELFARSRREGWDAWGNEIQ